MDEFIRHRIIRDSSRHLPEDGTSIDDSHHELGSHRPENSYILSSPTMKHHKIEVIHLGLEVLKIK